MLFSQVVQFVAENRGLILIMRKTSKQIKEILDTNRLNLKLCLNNKTQDIKTNLLLSELKKFLDTDLIITHLNICFQLFTTKNIKELLNYKNITSLVFSHNKIRVRGIKLIAKLMKEIKLQKLNLCNCIDGSIRGDGNIGAVYIAKGLQISTTLEILNLSYNKIDGKGIETICKALAYCTQLRCLNLEKNYFGDIGANFIAEAINNGMYKLTDLNINKNNIEEFQNIENALVKCSSLTNLNIGYNKGCDNICTIKSTILIYKKLTILDISYSHIGKNGVIIFSKILSQLITLSYLDIRGNDIGPEEATIFANGLKECKELQSLKLNDNILRPEGAAYIADALKECSKLNTLELDFCEIESAGATSIAGILKYCISITNLSFIGNNIGTDGVNSIKDVLSNNTFPVLKYLNLENNYIGQNNGIQNFVLILKLCPLIKLNLYNNVIGSIGLIYLADILPRCQTLIELNLSYNRINQINKLIIVLPRCSLQILNLYNNKIDTFGVLKLADVLPQCTTLTDLNLMSNLIGPEAANKLISVLPQCRLKYLDLNNNNLGEDTINRLKILHSSNTTQTKVIF